MSAVTNQATKFYIEKPGDEYWNTGYPKEVIEVDESPLDEYGERSLKVLNTAEFAQKWPSVSSIFFIECSGPARKLNYKEYVLLVHSLLPNRKLPVGFTSTDDKKVNL